MSDPLILIERPRDHVCLVTLNRAAAANAISPALTDALALAVERIEADGDIRACVLAAAGDRAFCAGADLVAVAEGRRTQLYTQRGGFAGFVDAARAKCWIAAVEGPALAGGLEIALSCDIIVAGERARFGLPEVTRGLVAAAGGLYRLPRRVGGGLAAEMIATGQPIDAARAREARLVDHLVPAGMALGRALDIAAAIASAAPVAVRESLAVARRAADETDDALRAASQAAALRNAATDDFREGPRAFIEKRSPVWTGRS